LLAGLAAVTGNAGWIETGAMAVGVIGMILSAVLTGIFASGDRIRANIYSESSEDRLHRLRFAFHVFALTFPCLVLALVHLYFARA
jgi:hypothetical protein